MNYIDKCPKATEAVRGFINVGKEEIEVCGYCETSDIESEELPTLKYNKTFYSIEEYSNRSSELERKKKTTINYVKWLFFRAFILLK